MDPESGLDAVRHVGIRAGTVVTISETPLPARASSTRPRHVVAPGFVDLHEHGQQDESYRMMVRDGVTSAFELEAGTADVAAWYAAREGGQVVNYGVSVGHIPARMKVLRDPGTGLLPAGIGGTGAATEAQVAEMEAILRTGLAQGAVAVGMGSAYTPGAPMAELARMFRVAAEGGASVHIHLRGGLAGLQETIAVARDAQARACTSCTSTPWRATRSTASSPPSRPPAMPGRTSRPRPIPYGAGMTEIQSALFDDWETWPEDRFAQHQLVSTGERLTRATFAKARRTAARSSSTTGPTRRRARRSSVPLSMIASDGFIENGRGHPRTSGTYAKVLGQYVRDEGAIPLMEALRRMTIEPARRIEPRAPAMANKGRIAVGADADLTIFDPATVKDRATYEDASIPSAGIPYVIVGGQVVVDNGAITAARPGRAVRGPVR